MADISIGVIGGTGLYEIEGLTDIEEIQVTTPYGEPSDAYFTGRMEGIRVVFLSRHGRGHKIAPHQLNYRANIYGFKKLGVQSLISVSAVGSMRKDIAPGHVVIPDQLFDRTRSRKSTFFEDGLVAHVQFADPYCTSLSEVLLKASQSVGVTVFKGGTLIVIEGPQFSTRAESNIFRKWGVDIIGMTALPEAKLAREAEMCYATLALTTDYDCWHEEEEDVSIESVISILKQNSNTAKSILREAVMLIKQQRSCSCVNALEFACMTEVECIPQPTKDKLYLLMSKYWKNKE